MKYLSSEPFSSSPPSKEYKEGWERIFGKTEVVNKFCIECGKIHGVDTVCTTKDTSMEPDDE